MKKLNSILFLIGFFVISCNKPPKAEILQAVVFKAVNTEPGLKSTVVCDNPIAQYALLTIQPTLEDGQTPIGDVINKRVDVFYLNGNIFSSTLNLPGGKYLVTSFVLMNDNGTPDNTDNDIPVMAVPLAGSEYANFVTTTLPLSFSVGVFMKNEIPVQVLCVDPVNYSNFGFSWFELNPLDLNTIYFYGDLCIDNIPAYQNTIYNGQNNGLGLNSEIPAIFKIDVYRNDEFLISYDNQSWLGENAVLRVQYPDYEGIDHYKFVLSVKVLVGNQLQYVQYYEWTSSDSGNLKDKNGQVVNISNGVLDFVVGSCDPSADLILPWKE